VTVELRDFEDAMKRLEHVVQQLESGKASLEESLTLFEEGMRLSKQLMELLSSAQGKVEQLLSDTPAAEEGSLHDGRSVEEAAPDSGTGA
jgi:exodeoxyribonuclease VII small subunit